jgi:Mlc titration factor MtfA (ptsG expression regulator)
VLDMVDGASDGTPELADRDQYAAWQRVMTAEYKRLVRESERGRASLLDAYGATNEAEFFAVASECFFERGVEMAGRHPRLYDLLRTFYRQDPGARFEADD